MSVTVGIDLGTTNSCVAVHTGIELPQREELIAKRQLVEVGDTLVIADPLFGPITPSVVWVAADGTVSVGARAKQLARTPGEPPPAMFFKRAMGRDGTVTAGHAALTPTQASTHVLRHLKELAERVLGMPVERAIVTVPAHFETTAKNATTEAAHAAGLDVVETLVEPVAGALAYADQGIGGPTGSPDGRTFLVYDLGGGTFDVSVVSWDSDGAIELRGTDGDRFLGGFEFDKALLEHVADENTAFDLAFDESVPLEAAARARLLITVEKAKIALSSEPHHLLLDQDMTDRTGDPAPLRMEITRPEFEGLIAKTVARTLEITEGVAERLRLAPGDIDEVVLVGGSARVPLVRNLLQERWARSPRELDPDLCVAAGAALRTAAADDTTEHLEISKPEVLDGFANIHGRVRAGGVVTSVSNQVITLTRVDGSGSQRTTSDAEGRFEFTGVPVIGEAEFLVQLVHRGAAWDTHRLVLSAGAPPPAIVDPLLARTFFVRTQDGLYPVVEGGQVKVPHEAHVPLVTVSRGTTLVVSVYEGDTVVGQLAIGGLPPDLPVGTPVEVDLTFTADWRIEASVRVPSVDARAEAQFTVAQTSIDEWPAVERRFGELRRTWNDRRSLFTGAEAMIYGPPIERLMDEVEELVRRRDDLVKANARVEALATRLPAIPQPTILEPPMSVFEDALQELESCCEALEHNGSKDAAPFRTSLATLREAGRTAYQRGEPRDWAQANESVRAYIKSAERLMPHRASREPSRPDAGAIQRGIVAEIDAQCRHVRSRDAETQRLHAQEADRLIAEGNRLRGLVQGVDVNASDAVGRLQRLDGAEVGPWAADTRDFPAAGVIGINPLGWDDRS